VDVLTRRSTASSVTAVSSMADDVAILQKFVKFFVFFSVISCAFPPGYCHDDGSIDTGAHARTVYSKKKEMR
jgi:hypothetical protein